MWGLTWTWRRLSSGTLTSACGRHSRRQCLSSPAASSGPQTLNHYRRFLSCMWVSPLSTISSGGHHNPFQSTDAVCSVKQEEVVRVFCCRAASFPVGASKAGGEEEGDTKVYQSVYHYQVFFLLHCPIISSSSVCSKSSDQRTRHPSSSTCRPRGMRRILSITLPLSVCS